MRGNQRSKHAIARVALVGIALLGWPMLASAQNPHVGLRLGVDLDSRDVLLSSSLAVPMTRQLDFYPSVDIYLPETGSRTGFNGDLKYRLPSVSGTGLYLGGGMNVLMRNVANRSDTDVGANAILGLESRLGRVHPFIEGRARVQDNTSLLLIGGLNITIGR